jgi:hypothetical protein
MARYLPSGLNDTHVADLTRSFAAQDLPPPGESKSRTAGDPIGELGAPRSLVNTAVLLRRSDDAVGVLGS